MRAAFVNACETVAGRRPQAPRSHGARLPVMLVAWHRGFGKMNLSSATAMRLASLATGVNVLVASGFSIAGLVSPQSILPATDAPNHASLIFGLYAAARTIPLALFALAAIYRRSAPALLILGAVAGLMQLLDAGIGVVQGDLGKTIGPLVIGVLQFASLYFLRKSVAEVSFDARRNS
jgi:hypothetical protein